MTSEFIWELIGYVGSALVVVSLLMSSVLKLRIINMTGSLIFCVYAVVIGSYPTAVMNGALVFINIYFLVKLLRSKSHFSFEECDTSNATLLRVLSKHEADIRTFFPDWNNDMNNINRTFIQFLDDEIAGITLAHENDDKSLSLIVDYSTPHYRDCKLGKFVYESLNEKGFHKLCYEGNSKIHRDFLTKMGFVAEGEALVKES